MRSAGGLSTIYDEYRFCDIQWMMENYGEDVWNYAFFMTKRHDQADDISQEVFIKAYQNFSSFRGEASIKTWLLKITRNTSFSFKKLAFFRKTILIGFISDKSNSTQSAHPSAKSEYMKHQYTDEIWNQVMKLPDKYRETLILYSHYQFNMKEISDVLNISEGTVKSRMHRARKRMVKLMEGGAKVSNLDEEWDEKLKEKPFHGKRFTDQHMNRVDMKIKQMESQNCIYIINCIFSNDLYVECEF